MGGDFLDESYVRSKYADSVYKILFNVAMVKGKIPTLVEFADMVKCPQKGRGRISQVIGSLEREGLVRRVKEDGITVQIVIKANNTATARRKTPATARFSGSKCVESRRKTRLLSVRQRIKQKAERVIRAREREKQRVRSYKMWKPIPRPPVYGIGNFAGCQWLDGEPKERKFCGEKTEIGSPWCKAHHARCYTAWSRKVEREERIKNLVLSNVY